jgi:hypothetical protein
MADEEKDIFDRHLRETKAKSKTSSFKELVTRMRSEQEFRRILENLSEKIHSQEIMPFLAVDKEKAEFSPDFLIWKDEFRIPVFLVEAIDDGEHITRKRLAHFLKYLKRTDLTEALIVWMSLPDFPSLLLQIEEIEKRVRSSDESFSFPNVKPFSDVAIESMRKKETVWPVPKSEALSEIMLPDTVLKSLESTFSRRFEREAAKRRPHLALKKESLQNITPETMQRIYSIISEYMRGELDIENFAKSFRLIAESTG